MNTETPKKRARKLVRDDLLSDLDVKNAEITLLPPAAAPLQVAPPRQQLGPRSPHLSEVTSAQKVALGLGSVASELGEAAKKAAFSVGFGTLGLGAVLFIAEHYGKTGASVQLLGAGAFFVLAAVGRIIDRVAKL